MTQETSVQTERESQGALQATQHIIDLFEKSKAQSEEALESLPGIYAVIGPDGQILKGNRTLASVLEVDVEELLSSNFRDLFPREDWEAFERRIAGDECCESSEFQTEICTKAGERKSYWWYVSRIPLKKPGTPFLFSVLGRDVTELNLTTERAARMKMELDTARAVQEALFPSAKATFGGSSVVGYYESASECGGDWWSYRLIGGQLFLFIGDVTGHGVAAALVTAAVHAVIASVGDQLMTPVEILSLLGRAVGAAGGNEKVMTFLVVSIDLQTGQGNYASAAHEPAFLLVDGKGPAGECMVKLLSSRPSTPLGESADARLWKESSFQLKSGERLFLYTDGLVEMRNTGDQDFSRRTLRRLLLDPAFRALNVDQEIEVIKGRLKEFRQHRPLEDDVTFLMFEYKA